MISPMMASRLAPSPIDVTWVAAINEYTQMTHLAALETSGTGNEREDTQRQNGWLRHSCPRADWSEADCQSLLFTETTGDDAKCRFDRPGTPFDALRQNPPTARLRPVILQALARDALARLKRAGARPGTVIEIRLYSLGAGPDTLSYRLIARRFEWSAVEHSPAVRLDSHPEATGIAYAFKWAPFGEVLAYLSQNLAAPPEGADAIGSIPGWCWRVRWTIGPKGTWRLTRKWVPEPSS